MSSLDEKMGQPEHFVEDVKHELRAGNAELTPSERALTRKILVKLDFRYVSTLCIAECSRSSHRDRAVHGQEASNICTLKPPRGDPY